MPHPHRLHKFHRTSKKCPSRADFGLAGALATWGQLLQVFKGWLDSEQGKVDHHSSSIKQNWYSMIDNQRNSCLTDTGLGGFANVFRRQTCWGQTVIAGH
jgi:hypothetical protein